MEKARLFLIYVLKVLIKIEGLPIRKLFLWRLAEGRVATNDHENSASACKKISLCFMSTRLGRIKLLVMIDTRPFNERIKCSFSFANG